MTTDPRRPAPAPDRAAERFLTSIRAEAGDRPHPAALALARQPRGRGPRNRRLTEFLRIDREIEV